MDSLHYLQQPLPCLVLRASSDIIRARIQALAELAGIDIRLAGPTDTSHSGVLLFEEEYGMKVPSIRASFHPSYASYFAEGSLVLDVEEEAGDILELMIAAGATSRGTVIGLLGSHGGVGTTTLACTLAHIVSAADATQSIALMDCDPLSTGIETWCGLSTPGINWADLSEKTGTLVPGRLAKALPGRGNLHVLSADERAGMPVRGELPSRAITALSQSHDMTLMDFPRSIVMDNTELLSWCDTLILVTDTSPHAVPGSRRTLAFLKEHYPQIPLILAVNRVSGGAQAASIAYDIGVDTIAPIRLARTLTKDLEHGVPLGERHRSGMYKDIARLATMLEGC
ncbi:MAG: hypothetical protein IKS49_05565 [Actinomycetaceae bacterium]|nr:hypothetical protein [Actinomycetaceae bacterium]